MSRTMWAIAALIVVCLRLDTAFPSVNVQIGIACAAYGILLIVGRRLPARQRHQVWVCVGVATLVELFGSQLWGVYHYQLGNIPMYVPPGHGLVYLLALRGAAWVQPRLHVLKPVALGGAALWGLAGVSVIPALGGRMDLLGLSLVPAFFFFVTRTSRASLFIAAFAATSGLEIFGTWFGAWRWVQTAPYVHLPVGNPPSVIAGAYCILDAAVLIVMRYAIHERPVADISTETIAA